MGLVLVSFWFAALAPLMHIYSPTEADNTLQARHSHVECPSLTFDSAAWSLEHVQVMSSLQVVAGARQYIAVCLLLHGWNWTRDSSIQYLFTAQRRDGPVYSSLLLRRSEYGLPVVKHTARLRLSK